MRVNGHDLAVRIGRTHPKITKYRFAYSERSELRKLHQRIKVYFLLYSPTRGNGIDDFIFYLRDGKSAPRWSDYLRAHGIAAYSSRWIPTVNTHRGKDWRVVRLLLFHAYGRKSGRRQGSNV